MNRFFCLLVTAFAALMSFSAQAQDQAVDNSAFILTPPAPDAPRINGPKIYGARPKAEFIFRIPTTGVRPITPHSL